MGACSFRQWLSCERALGKTATQSAASLGLNETASSGPLGEVEWREGLERVADAPKPWMLVGRMGALAAGCEEVMAHYLESHTSLMLLLKVLEPLLSVNQVFVLRQSGMPPLLRQLQQMTELVLCEATLHDTLVFLPNDESCENVSAQPRCVLLDPLRLSVARHGTQTEWPGWLVKTDTLPYHTVIPLSGLKLMLVAGSCSVVIVTTRAARCWSGLSVNATGAQNCLLVICLVVLVKLMDLV